MLAEVKRGLTGLLAALALLGCSSGPDEQPKPITGGAKEAARAIARLEAAAQRREFRTICDQLLTRDARRRAGGGDCAQLLRSAVEDVRRPSIDLLSLRVEGNRVQARVRSRAASQAAVDETIELVRVGRRYRIASLSP